MSEEETQVSSTKDAALDVFFVHSQVRRVGTRTTRAKQPTRARFKQYLFGDPSKRLVRNRPVRISLNELSQNIDKLVEDEDAGVLSVHAADGRRVDLKALKAGYLKLGERLSASPPPHPPLDSIANDTPAGEKMAMYVDGTFPGDPAAARTLQEMGEQKRREAERHGATEESEDAFVDPAASSEQSTLAESPSAKQGKGKHGKHGKERG